jgi:hypothetical protein
MLDGRRLTMKAERLDGDRLVGESGVLGTTAVDLATCDNLVLGLKESATPPAELPYGKWKLKPAALPRALGTGEAAAPAAGGRGP